MSALIHIRSARSNMSAIKRRIADFIVDNAHLLRDYSSQQFANALQIIQSSVVKLIQKLGFKGYPDPKFAIFGSVTHRSDGAEPSEEKPTRSSTESPMPPLQRLLIAMIVCVVSASARAAEPRWTEGQQLVRVTTSDWDANTGEMQRFERKGNAWLPIGQTIKVSIGRNGSAWGKGLHAAQSGPQKVEGDGRSPAGLFKIGPAFGYEPALSSGLRYQAMTATHYCVDVPASPHYNRIVDSRKVGAAAVQGSTEPMRRDLHLDGDMLYKMGFVIDHNPQHIPSAGSCIFAHLWRAPGSPTAGCTAMNEAAMRTLLGWLDRKRRPQIVLMPGNAYDERVVSWQLPSLR